MEGRKINIFGLVGVVGFAALGGLAYTYYNMTQEKKAEGACPIDHAARKEMIEIGKKQKK